MSLSLLSTKLSIPPRRAERVPRSRLVEGLEAGLLQGDAEVGFARRLTLVSAPAGFGKTTLVTEWLAGSELPAAWLSLDEGDNDPARFFTYFLAAVQQVDGDAGQTAMMMLQAPQPPPPEALLTSLINDLAATPEPFLLVLDDYHLIQSLPIHQQLSFLVEQLPPTVHLVIASREDPPLPLARLRARGQVCDVRQRDLAFSEAETGSFMRQVMALELAAAEVAALQRRTEGWIAGLQLAGLSLQRSEDMGQFVADFSGSHRYILDYLAEEVYRRQIPSVQEFLLKTSILERLCAPLCDAVTGRDDAQQVLLGLDQANLFVVRLDESRHWYRYHRLFRDLLRAQGSLVDRRPLHLRAAAWYAQQGMLEEAMGHALAAEDWDVAERLAEPASAQAINNGRYTTVGRWLEALPEERLRANPALATLKGWILMPAGQFEAAEGWAKVAAEALPEDAPALSRALVTCLQLNLAHARYELPQVIELAHQVLAFLEEGDPYGLRGTALANLASAQMAGGDLPAATKAFREMARLGQEAGHPISAVGALSSLASLLHLQNEPREAEELARRALEWAVGPRGQPLPLAGQAHIVLGRIAYDRNELGPAAEQLALGLELGRQAGPSTGIMGAAYTLARIQALSGQGEAALATVSANRQAVSQLNLPLVDAFVAANEAEFSLSVGDVAAAARWAEAAGLSAEDSPEYAREGEFFTLARLLLAQDRLVEAQTLLANLEQYARDRGLQRSLLTVHILRAGAERAAGQKAEALASLEEAVRLAAPAGYGRAFLDDGAGILDWLPRVRSVAPAFVDRVLEGYACERPRAAADGPCAVPPSAGLVEPLSQRELEVLGLVAQGLSNRQIADRLFITVGTVKTHVHNILGKLGVERRTEAAVRASDLGLV